MVLNTCRAQCAIVLLQIYKCSNDNCPRPGCYRSCASNKADTFPCTRAGCNGNFTLQRFVHCACVCVCVCVCVYCLCMSVCVCVMSLTCMYVRTYVHMYVCMYAFMHACIHVCMYVCIYVNMYMCIACKVNCLVCSP